MSLRWSALLVVVLAAGCVTPRPNGERPTPSSGAIVHACPLGVASTRIVVVDTKEGIDLELSATLPSQVTELRRRVRDQTRGHGPQRHEGLGHDGRHGLAHEHGLRLWSMPPLHATVYDAPAGARLALVPVDARDRDAMREAVVKRVAFLEARGCPD